MADHDANTNSNESDEPSDESSDGQQEGDEERCYHVVADGETLNSIALSYPDLTPAALASHNRLTMSSFICPGVRLSLKPMTTKKKRKRKKNKTPADDRNYPPVHEEVLSDDEFIKLDARHVTPDMGVVGGSLLLTDKSVLFCPHEADPVVIAWQAERASDAHLQMTPEREAYEYFQLILPVEVVINVGIFTNFIAADSAANQLKCEQRDDVGDARLLTLDDLQDCCPAPSTDNIDAQHCADVDSDAATDKTRVARDTEFTLTTVRYLRIVTGKPRGGRKLPPNTAIMSFGEQRLAPEYWFIVETDRRAAALARFFSHSQPFTSAEDSGSNSSRYGPLTVATLDSLNMDLIARPADGDVIGHVGATDGSTSRSTVAALARRAQTITSVDLCGELIGGPSLIMTDDQERLAVERRLPARTFGADWHLTYATANDGYSLAHMLAKVERFARDEAGDSESGVLLFIADTSDNRFGAYLSQSPVCDDRGRIQGTGESFVFALDGPSTECYLWSGENELFYQCKSDALIVGSCDGRFAIWLDADLNRGRSQACATFDSRPLTVAEDFTVRHVECWTLVQH